MPEVPIFYPRKNPAFLLNKFQYPDLAKIKSGTAGTYPVPLHTTLDNIYAASSGLSKLRTTLRTLYEETSRV